MIYKHIAEDCRGTFRLVLVVVRAQMVERAKGEDGNHLFLDCSWLGGRRGKTVIICQRVGNDS